MSEERERKRERDRIIAVIVMKASFEFFYFVFLLLKRVHLCHPKKGKTSRVESWLESMFDASTLPHQ